MKAELTLGAEEELHLIDLHSGKLSARAPQLLSRLPSANYSAEIQRSTVETNTNVVHSLSGLRDELLRLRRGLIHVASSEGIGVAAVGTAPRSGFADFELTTTGRYSRMQEQYRLLVDEQLICGTQIHVGVSDRDLAVQIAQRISRDLSVLLALSASSPFWNGQDTGYASIRTIIWQRWPSAGATGHLNSAAEYDELLADLIRSGVIADAKMAYFDVRPSAHAPTLELRVCDACPLVDDAILIAGLFRAMVRAAELDIETGKPHRPIRAPLHRAAMWQAARGGLSGVLLDGSEHPQPIPAADAVRALIRRLREPLEELGDYDDVNYLAETTLARGNSSDRQRAAFAENGDIDDVVRLVVAETHGPAGGPVPDEPTLRMYRTRAGDEAVGLGARARPAYRSVFEYYLGLDDTTIRAQQEARDAWIRKSGLTFGVSGAHRDFRVDLMPRIINHYEWSELEAGLVQRARALELFLRDVYGERRIVHDGVLPESVIVDSPGWRAEGLEIPADVVRAPVMGFDIIRNEFGGWRILEDNVRDPSGAAYGVAVRRLMDSVVPDLPRPAGLYDPSEVFDALRYCLHQNSRTGSSAALLTSGPGSPAYFEHRALAQGSGIPLLEADDLDVDHGRVVSRETGERIDALYIRLDGELIDLLDAEGRPLGREILGVAREGHVFLANAPGNGVADDKALYCYVPELIGYYLGERPLIESVPTYRPGEPTEQRAVLERVGELVTKPVDGHGGSGVLIGPSATAAMVAERRRAIALNGRAWVAQEVVALSSHPTFHGGSLEPRHVDLRAFVYLRGTEPEDCHVSRVALTRVAPADSLIVNSSRGGGAKDTWITGPVTTRGGR